MMKRILFSVILTLCFISSAVRSYAANAIVQLDSSNGTSSLFIHDSASTAVGTQVFGVDSDGNAVVVDNAWFGLGASAGRIQFDDTTTDVIGFLNYDVGIGTTNVNQGYLHLVGSGDAVLAVQSPDANSARINLFRTSGDTGWSIYKPKNSLDLLISDAGSDRMSFISSNTKVGIGTTAPATALEIQGNITFKSGSDIRPTGDSTVGIAIANASGTDFVIFDTTNSRVNIATTPGSTTLVVNDNITLGSGSDIRPSTNATNAINIANNAGTDFVIFDTTNSRVGLGVTLTPQVDLHLQVGNSIFVQRATTGKAWSLSAVSNTDRLGMYEYTQTWGTGLSGNLRHSFRTGTGNIVFSNSDSLIPANALDVVGNVCLGNTAAGSSATRTLVLVNGTAPTTSPVDSVQLYAADVSASSELFVRDEAGNATQLSPHDPITGEWVFYSKNIKTGRVVRVEMEKFVKAAEELTGKKFMTETWEGPKQE